mmetsp:Transcript_172832/g.554084  ORF Transcript_172832/g.554084 Transcript_172832/m.554084 type:complete len:214 (+) Transcript_172832:113-754(+)
MRYFQMSAEVASVACNTSLRRATYSLTCSSAPVHAWTTSPNWPQRERALLAIRQQHAEMLISRTPAAEGLRGTTQEDPKAEMNQAAQVLEHGGLCVSDIRTCVVVACGTRRRRRRPAALPAQTSEQHRAKGQRETDLHHEDADVVDTHHPLVGAHIGLKAREAVVAGPVTIGELSVLLGGVGARAGGRGGREFIGEQSIEPLVRLPLLGSFPR